MRTMKIIRFFFAAFAGALLCQPAVSAKGTSDVLPADMSVGVFIRMNSDDAGIKWVMDSYKKNFLLDHMGEQSQTVVEDFSLVEVDEASVVFLEDSNVLGQKPRMLLVGDIVPSDASITFKVKNMDFKLNIKERSEEKGLQSAVVKALLGALVKAPDRTFLANELAYSPSLEKERKVCAYAINKNRVIVGNDLMLVQDALKNTLEQSPPPSVPNLRQFLGDFEKPQDLLVYFNNQAGFLTRYNEQLEKKLKIPLLTSAASVRCAAIFVDLVDADHAELRGIFLVDDPAKISATKEDLSFLVEFFRRKMLVEGITSTAVLEEAPGQVQVKMSLSNTEAFIAKWLKKGRIKKKPS